MSVDTNKLDIASDSNTFTIKLSVDSFYSSSFDSYLESLYNVGRKNVLKLTLSDLEKAVLCFSRSRLMSAASGDFDELEVRIFYPFQDRHIASLKEKNLSIITNHSLLHCINTFSDSTSGNTSLISDGTVVPVLLHNDTDLIVYSFSPDYVGNYQKISVPEPLCTFYSNPLAGHFSSHYKYANNANSPCCSNSQLTKDSDTVFTCSFSCHSQCPYYSPQSVILESLTAVDKVNSNQNFLFQLIKSRYSDFTIRYSITNDGISSFNQTYPLDSSVTEQDLDDQMRVVFHSIVDDFSHSKEPASVSVDSPKKRSFISTIVKL